MEDVGRQLDLDPEKVGLVIKSASTHRDAFLHRERHKRLGQMGLKCPDCLMVA